MAGRVALLAIAARPMARSGSAMPDGANDGRARVAWPNIGAAKRCLRCPRAAAAGRAMSGASRWAFLPGEKELGAWRRPSGDAHAGTRDLFGRRSVKRDHRCARTAADAMAAWAEIAARFAGLGTGSISLLAHLPRGCAGLARVLASCRCKRLAMADIIRLLPHLGFGDKGLGAHHRRGNACRDGYEDRHQAKKPKADEFHALEKKKCRH